MKALLVAKPGKHALLEEVLEQRGHRLHVVAETSAAAELQRREHYPLVFVDFSNSGERVALAALAREAGGSAVVALVDESPGDLRAAVSTGATDWLRLSSSREMLEARISLLERESARLHETEALCERLGVVERERARLEGDLQTLLNASPDPIAIHRDGAILFGNPGAARSFGFNSPAELIGTDIFALIHPDDQQAVRARVRHVLETGEPAQLRRERFRRRDGADLVGEAYSFRILFEREPAVLTVGRDLTEPWLLETQLLHSERLARIGGMTAAIAHELKNPLTYVICNLADLCRRLPALADRLPSEVVGGLEARVDAALEGVERLRAITQDLSTFARTSDEQLQRVELGHVLESVLRMAGPELNGLEVTTELEPMPAVMGNDVRLAQVFLNLLSNAAHAVRESRHEPKSIRLRGRSDERGWATVEVSDTGVGIEPGALGRVFEPFYTTKSAGDGTGLGLSVTHTIVTRLGGTISVASEPGRGATFRVSLPPAAPG
jgi:two-component system, NtrC family, sensor kinase